MNSLQDQIYREKVMRARQMPPEEKFLAGAELFEYAATITLAGIARQNPKASSVECLQILRDRLDLRERLNRLAP